MSLIATALSGLRDDIIGYLRELCSLLPTVARFVKLIAMGMVATVGTPIYGIFFLSAYLWSEAGWSKKLNTPQKILFWSTVIPAGLTQWGLAVYAMKSFGLT